jgi:hypothetical protein
VRLFLRKVFYNCKSQDEWDVRSSGNHIRKAFARYVNIRQHTFMWNSLLLCEIKKRDKTARRGLAPPPPPSGKNVDLLDSYDMQIEAVGQTEVTWASWFCGLFQQHATSLLCNSSSKKIQFLFLASLKSIICTGTSRCVFISISFSFRLLHLFLAA